jgi:hypothetical protein
MTTAQTVDDLLAHEERLVEASEQARRVAGQRAAELAKLENDRADAYKAGDLAAAAGLAASIDQARADADRAQRDVTGLEQAVRDHGASLQQARWAAEQDQAAALVESTRSRAEEAAGQLAEAADAFLEMLAQASAAERTHLAALDRHHELLDALQPTVNGVVRRQQRTAPPGSRPISQLFMRHQLLAQLPGYAPRG